MLNGKSYDFEGSVGSVYTFASQKLSSSNKAASNGVLHKMEKCVLFASNIWEQLAKEPAVSDLYKFLVKDYDTIFNENASVKGPIVDGGTKSCHKKCSACGVTTQGENYHSYTKTTEIAATCVTKGTSRYTCTCGYTYTSQDIAINPSNC